LLDAADQLPLEEQEDLVEILRKRVSARRRDEIAEEIQEARRDFAAGECRPSTPADILKTILS
jgi:predicted AAA+ superfamily ATPase